MGFHDVKHLGFAERGFGIPQCEEFLVKEKVSLLCLHTSQSIRLMSEN